ncbi:hypothetical protein RFI_15240, partial [Reticulomyxa filosa]
RFGFSKKFVFAYFFIYVHVTYMYVHAHNKYIAGEEMQPRIHQELVRQANHKKYMETQRLYNRPRVSISVPATPQVDSEIKDNDTPHKSNFNAASGRTANRAQLEEVAEEPADWVDDSHFDTNNLQHRYHNTDTDDITPNDDDNGIAYLNSGQAIQALRSEIQEVRSASAVNLERIKQNVAQRRRRLHMKT